MESEGTPVFSYPRLAMQILVVVPYYKPAYIYGGPTRSTAALCEGMVQAGHNVTVFTTDAAGERTLELPISQPVIVSAVTVHYFRRGLRWRPMFFYSPGLARACEANASGYDAVYIAGTWTYPLLAAARAADRANVPYVISPRGSFMTWAMREGYLKKRIYLRLVERRFLERAAAIHCTTGLEARQMSALHFSPQTVVIPNGIDSSLFTHVPDRGKWRRSLKICDNDRLSIFSGRLVKDKRLPLIIECFATVAGVLADSYLAIAGPDYGEGPAVVAAIARLGLQKRVFLLGDLSWNDLFQLYADSDMLVMLSWRESFGMAVAEAMAAGRAVLVSEDVGLADEVTEARAGLVVPSRVSEISREWIRMLAEEDLNEFGRNGRTYALEHFSRENVARAMIRTLGGAAAAAGREDDLISGGRTGIR